jgi:GT2 family glycosyltransferase
MSIYKNDKLLELQTALESLYKQTQKGDIFLQIDGKISKEIEAYLDMELNSKKITYIGKREQNLGLATSLNELLEIVLKRGYRYIVRMDADDISVSTRIEKQVSFLEKNPQISAVGAWIEEFNIDTGESQIVKYGESSDELKQNLIKRNPLAHVTICFRDSFFDKVSCYDTDKKNEDYDLWIRAFEKDIKLYCLQEVLVKVRVSNDFFKRRRDFKRAYELISLKVRAGNLYNKKIIGFFYGVAHFVLFLSPNWIKRYLYKKIRN